MISYFAKYKAKKGDLIGGVARSQTSRFGSREEAQLRLDGTIEINKGNCEGNVVASSLPPEIFAHCDGRPSQTIGGKCFGCGKVLTKEDAREYGERVKNV